MSTTERCAVRSAFQPVVDLTTGAVVGFEALARAADGTSPAQLFAAATAEGWLSELDAACRAAALDGAVGLGMARPLSLFVNVEPAALDARAFDDLPAMARRAAEHDLRLVLEVTERAMTTRPAELLEIVRHARAHGWHLALDDVGADPTSLALMPLMEPDIVKLDLRLVQQRPNADVAQIMNAANAYAESTGARLLAEGIEDEQHLAAALSLGATLGQGWRFGFPTHEPSTAVHVGDLGLDAPRATVVPRSPFSCLPESITLRRASKGLLVEVSKQLEREALRLGGSGIVLSAFQHARHMTPASSRRYEQLADALGLVGAVGEAMATTSVPGIHTGDLAPGDPLCEEWDIVVVGPHFAAALLARDLHSGPEIADQDRLFEFALTYDRAVVVGAARSLLMALVEPSPPGTTVYVDGHGARVRVST